MRAYVVESGKAVEPFGDHPGDCLIANRRLADIQRELLVAAGFEPKLVAATAAIEDSAEYLVLGDDVYFTRELLTEFLAESRRRRAPTVCALRPGLGTLRTVVATQDVTVFPERVEYDLHYSPGSRAGPCAGPEQPVVIAADRFAESTRFPAHIAGSDGYLVPLSEKAIVQIDHWTNLWAANMASRLAELARLKLAPPRRLIGLALRARSTNQWRVLEKATRVGNNCDIHPTAYLEGSELGNGVKVGARAVVRESLIGDDALVGTGATVDTSVVGSGSAVLNGCNVMYSVLYPGTCVATRLVSVSVTGYDTEIANEVGLTDFRFDGRDIEVLKNGTRVDTRLPLLGGCLGHGVYLGSGVILAPGRAVPNGWRVVPDETHTLSSLRCEESIAGYRLVRPTRASSSATAAGRGAR